jgi:hypothetical protein
MWESCVSLVWHAPPRLSWRIENMVLMRARRSFTGRLQLSIAKLGVNSNTSLKSSRGAGQTFLRGPSDSSTSCGPVISFSCAGCKPNRRDLVRIRKWP